MFRKTYVTLPYLHKDLYWQTKKNIKQLKLLIKEEQTLKRIFRIGLIIECSVFIRPQGVRLKMGRTLNSLK